MSNHRILLTAAAILSPLGALAANTLRVEEIPADFITQDYGTARADATVEGEPLVIAGVKYDHGLGTHAKSVIPIRLDGAKARFTGFVGLPDSVKGTAARVEFLVQGDGKTLWKSDRMTPGMAAKAVDVDLTGVKHLKLVVTDGGNGITSDHAVWAGASIVTEGAMPEADGIVLRLPLGDASLTLRERDGLVLVSTYGPAGATIFSGPAYPVANDLHHRIAPVRVTFADGSDALDLRYASHKLQAGPAGATHLSVVLRDKVRPFEITLHYLAHADTGVLEQWVEARNAGDKPVRLDALASAYLPFARDHGAFADLYTNQWGSEMRRVQATLDTGVRAQESRSVCRHITGAAPHFALSWGDKPAGEESGLCVVGSLAWSGNARLMMEKGPEGSADFIAGVLPEGGAYTLDAGATLATPKVILACSKNGLGEASRKLHRWARVSGLRDGAKPRYIDNNSWEGAFFDVGEKRLLAMIEGSAKLGIELYLLDDGWFGNGEYARNGDRAGLGDWQLNTKKIPSLDRIIDACETRGMKFGIWVEPEMVNEKSNLYVAHPEWVLRYPDREPFKNRNQLVLDLSNPAVQEFVFKSVDDVLTAYPKIAYIKWDNNSDVNAPHSTFLAPDRQGELPWKYMQGYYSVLKRLVAKHPNVFFQACSSGGGHADYGAMEFSHTFWPSDNTSPGYRLKAAWSYSVFLPALAITSHATHSGGGYSPKYRMDMSFFGQFGLELDPAHLQDDYRAAAVVAIADYKKVRDTIQFGDQYRTLSPFDGPVAAVDYVSPDKSRAVLLGYRSGSKDDLSVALPLRGLDAGKTYALRELNLPAGERPRLAASAKSVSGADLLKNGLPVAFKGDNDSVSVELTAE